MARSPFTIIERKNTAGKRVFMARFVDSEGKYTRSITLPEAKSRTQAVRMAEELLKGGIIANEKNPEALAYMLEFWAKDSAYAKGKALRGKPLSDQYINEMHRVVKTIAAPYLKEKRLLDLSPALLEHMILRLDKEKRGARTINLTLQALKVPFAYFCRMNRLSNTLPAVQKIHETGKKRGILAITEVQAIIETEESPRIKAAVLLGCLCGLRLGEARGLQWEDVDAKEMIVNIRHNYVTDSEGLKGPKWNSIRSVPLPSPVIDALKDCGTISNGSPYILFNEARKDKPMERNSILRGFSRLLEKIDINDAERKTRNLCFHGLRHTFVSLTRSNGIPDYIVMQMAGHSSMAMTERYSHSEGIIDFKAAREALEAQLKVSGEAKK
jgi:integrase